MSRFMGQCVHLASLSDCVRLLTSSSCGNEHRLQLICAAFKFGWHPVRVVGSLISHLSLLPSCVPVPSVGFLIPRPPGIPALGLSYCCLSGLDVIHLGLCHRLPTFSLLAI